MWGTKENGWMQEKCRKNKMKIENICFIQRNVIKEEMNKDASRRESKP